VLGVVLDGLKSEYVDRITASLVLKGGQGTMTDLAKEELSTKNIVKVENKNWNWSNDTRKEPRFAILTVDKAQAEGTVITLDGLTSLMDNNQDMFQVTQGKVREGLPMLRAEVRLIGKEGLTGAERDAQLAAFRELILDTNRQNFFIKVNGGKEIHMRGYAPTSAYKAEYEALRVTLHWMQMFIIQIPKVPLGELNFRLAHVMLMNVYHLEKHILILLNG